jgi:hypothetical protein
LGRTLGWTGVRCVYAVLNNDNDGDTEEGAEGERVVVNTSRNGGKRAKKGQKHENDETENDSLA